MIIVKQLQLKQCFVINYVNSISLLRHTDRYTMNICFKNIVFMCLISFKLMQFVENLR